MRHVLAVAVSAMCVGWSVLACAWAADESSDTARGELLGTWRGYVVEGKGEQPDRGPVHLELTITRHRITAIQFQGGQEVDLGEGTFDVQHEASPCVLDAQKKLANPNRREVWLGIYELRGDTLKWCVGRRTRPESFETREGAFLMILRRTKP
jgi:uncharacterized protein (TIGR03067 family)